MVSISSACSEPRSELVIGVVDSRPEDYWQFAEQAEARGLYCRYATTAGAALQLAERARPVLWLINLDLPDVDGLELCRLLCPRLTRTPHFFVADEYDPQAEIAVLSAGGHLFCKPVPGVVLESLAAQGVDARRSAAKCTMPLVA